MAAGREVGVFVVRLRVKPPTYVLRPAGRRYRNDSGNLCAHGYQAFFDALFARAPGAAVTTAIAKYLGRSDFENRRHGDLERATEMFPETCDCRLAAIREALLSPTLREGTAALVDALLHELAEYEDDDPPPAWMDDIPGAPETVGELRDRLRGTLGEIAERDA